MKGATHNLVVRTRTDVALYVLNHKRGHLRDLENGFKVSLAVIADASVSGPQAYLIDRGEQVHTLEAAKALLAAQAAASPPPLVEEAFDDEEFDAELESEVETEETEGLAEEQAAGDASPDQDGQRRKRRRRRRGRGGQRDGEAREDGAPASAEGAVAVAGEGEEDAEAEQDGEEGENQAGQARGEQEGGSDRRRRRGRRGGRRRRGNGEEGLAGSIGDELTGNPPSEATEAVADFDSSGSETAPSIAHSDHIAPVETSQPEFELQAPVETPVQPAPSAAVAEEEPASDDKAARRRSTVREKVSFLSSSPSEAAAPVASAPAPVASAPEPVAPPEPAPEATDGTSAAPRRAGWWSRRFGGGE
jgi:ribonuclease E